MASLGIRDLVEEFLILVRQGNDSQEQNEAALSRLLDALALAKHDISLTFDKTDHPDPPDWPYEERRSIGSGAIRRGRPAVHIILVMDATVIGFLLPYEPRLQVRDGPIVGIHEARGIGVRYTLADPRAQVCQVAPQHGGVQYIDDPIIIDIAGDELCSDAS